MIPGDRGPEPVLEADDAQGPAVVPVREAAALDVPEPLAAANGRVAAGAGHNLNKAGPEV